MRSRFYIPSSGSQRDDLPLWDLESLENETYKSSVPSHLFAQHTVMLASDSNLGFRKEFDFIISCTSPPKCPGNSSREHCYITGFLSALSQSFAILS